MFNITIKPVHKIRKRYIIAYDRHILGYLNDTRKLLLSPAKWFKNTRKSQCKSYNFWCRLHCKCRCYWIL